MFIPLLSKRKGGGGGGHGGGGHSSGKGSSSVGKGSNGGTTSRPSIQTPTGNKDASVYGKGGGPTTIIPVGSPFSGRHLGGGNRTGVYGTRVYGSGYPYVSGRGVQGRDFPYYFWPIVWVATLSAVSTSTYLYATSEYNLPGYLGRPGGYLIDASFKSSTGTIYRVQADNATVSALYPEIRTQCASFINDSNTAPVPDSGDLAHSGPEQAIQYYRASSVVLTLDGYNNTAISEPEGTPDTPLPTNIDNDLLECINATVGEAVPLVDHVVALMVPTMTLVSLSSVVLILAMYI